MKGFNVLLMFVLSTNFVNAQVTSATDCTDQTPYVPFKPASRGQSTTRLATPPVVDTYYVCFSKTGEAIEKPCPTYYEFNKNMLACSFELTGDDNTDTTCSKVGQELPKKCTYILCGDNLTPETKTCVSGTFNKFLGKCIPGTQAECPENDNDRPDCSLPIYTSMNLADVTDCQSYYSCLNGMRIKHKCPTGQHFDPLTQVCRDEKISKCAPSTPSSTSAASIKDICKGKAAKFIADPNYCRGYYYCVDEKTPYWGYCADKKYFDNGFCVTSRPSTCTCEDADYEQEATVYVPLPDKTKFYICKEGQAPSLQSCPKGYTFDPSENSCV